MLGVSAPNPCVVQGSTESLAGSSQRELEPASLLETQAGCHLLWEAVPVFPSLGFRLQVESTILPAFPQPPDIPVPVLSTLDCKLLGILTFTTPTPYPVSPRLGGQETWSSGNPCSPSPCCSVCLGSFLTRSYPICPSVVDGNLSLRPSS